jgi:hypothetical protein
MLVSKRHKDDALVHERAQARNHRALLTTALSARGYENAGIFPMISSRCPLLACLVPEGLPLGGEVTVSGGRRMLGMWIFKGGARDIPGGDTKEERVEGLELRRVGEGFDVCRFGGCVHFGEDFVGEGLCDSAVKLVWRLPREKHEFGLGKGDAYWKSVTDPPASSMPFFSASASWRMWPYME